MVGGWLRCSCPPGVQPHRQLLTLNQHRHAVREPLTFRPASQIRGSRVRLRHISARDPERLVSSPAAPDASAREGAAEPPGKRPRTEAARPTPNGSSAGLRGSAGDGGAGREQRPGPSREGWPGPSREQRSAPSREGRPAPSRDERPAPSRESRPAPSREERPGPSRESRPAPSRDERPGPSRESRPAPSRDERPGPSREEPAPRGLDLRDTLKRLRGSEQRPAGGAVAGGSGPGNGAAHARPSGRGDARAAAALAAPAERSGSRCGQAREEGRPSERPERSRDRSPRGGERAPPSRQAEEVGGGGRHVPSDRPGARAAQPGRALGDAVHSQREAGARPPAVADQRERRHHRDGGGRPPVGAEPDRQHRESSHHGERGPGGGRDPERSHREVRDPGSSRGGAHEAPPHRGRDVRDTPLGGERALPPAAPGGPPSRHGERGWPAPAVGSGPEGPGRDAGGPRARLHAQAGPSGRDLHPPGGGADLPAPPPRRGARYDAAAGADPALGDVYVDDLDPGLGPVSGLQAAGRQLVHSMHSQGGARQPLQAPLQGALSAAPAVAAQPLLRGRYAASSGMLNASSAPLVAAAEAGPLLPRGAAGRLVGAPSPGLQGRAAGEQLPAADGSVEGEDWVRVGRRLQVTNLPPRATWQDLEVCFQVRGRGGGG